MGQEKKVSCPKGVANTKAWRCEKIQFVKGSVSDSDGQRIGQKGEERQPRIESRIMKF